VAERLSRILVIGGRGHLGSRVLAAVQRLNRVQARVASRSAGVKLNLRKPKSLDVLGQYDVVINCSDSRAAPPDLAVKRVLERGGVLLECTADPPTAEHLLRRYQDRSDGAGARGTVILGVGIFPGLSNLLARAAWEAAAGSGPAPDELVLGIRFSPFAGAGAGAIRLMTDLLKEPAVRYVQGERIEEPAILPAKPMRFGRRMRRTVRAGLPEATMLHASPGAGTTEVRIAIKPGLLHPPALAITSLLPESKLLRGLALAPAHFGLLVMRGLLLRSRRERVELVAEARSGGVARATAAVRVRDGFATAGDVTAAIVRLLLDRQAAGTLPRGLRLVDEVVDLAQVTGAVGRRGGEKLNVELKVTGDQL